MTINISQSQASAFAYSISTDISDYVKGHQTEYVEFLKQEEQKAGNMQ